MAEDWITRSRFSMEEPEKARMTLTISAQLKNWIAFCEHLDKIAQHESPVASLVFDFRHNIKDMVQQAKAAYWPKEKP